MQTKRQWFTAISVLVVISFVTVWFLRGRKTSELPEKGKLYAVYKSPDGLHRIEVYSFELKNAFPGQAGDAPGEVVLKDSNGDVLNRKNVEMVQLVQAPLWKSDSVSEKLIFDWKIGPH